MKHYLYNLILFICLGVSSPLAGQVTYLSHTYDIGCLPPMNFLRWGTAKAVILPSGNILNMDASPFSGTSIVKYSRNGTKLFHLQQYGAYSAIDVELSGDTTLVMVGSNGSYSYIESLDTNLTERWTLRSAVISPKYITCEKVCLDHIGNIYSGGITNLPVTANRDIVILKHSLDGTAIWKKTLNILPNDSLSDIQCISNGSLLISTKSGHLVKLSTDGVVQWAQYPYPPSGRLYQKGDVIYMTNDAAIGAEYITMDTNGVITGGRRVNFGAIPLTYKAVAEDLFVTPDGHVGILLQCYANVPYITMTGGSGTMNRSRMGIMMLRPDGSVIYARQVPMGGLAGGGCGSFIPTSGTLQETSGNYMLYDGKRNFVVGYNYEVNGSVSGAFTANGMPGICISDTAVPPSCMTVLPTTGVGPPSSFSPGFVSVSISPLSLPEVPSSLGYTMFGYVSGSPCCNTPTATGTVTMTGALGTFSAPGISPLLTAWWDFGDGATSTGPSATHLYLPGTYTPCLHYSNACTTYVQCMPPVTVCAATPPSILASGSLLLCPSDSVILTVPPGYALWNWSTGSTDSSIVASTTTSISLVAMDSAGCSGGDTVSVFLETFPPVGILGDTSICTGDTAVLSASGSYFHYEWVTGDTSGSIATATSGTYTLTVTSPIGCVDSASLALTVKPDSVPEPLILPGPGIVKCADTTVTLGTSLPYAAYNWTAGSTSSAITVSAPGSYTVTVTTAAGCTGISDPVVITDLPAPVATLTPSDTAYLCPGGSVTVTASPGPSYVWSTGDTTSAITISTPGDYWVEVTNAFGCDDVSDVLHVLPGTPVPPFTLVAVGPLSFCAGGVMWLYPSVTGSSYAWSDGSTAYVNDILVSGTYTVTVTNATGCVGASPPVTVTVSPVPTPVITATPSPACAGDTVILSTSGYPAYLWLPSATSGPSVSVTTPGTWTVRATSPAGCVGESAPYPVSFLPLPSVSLSLPFDTVCVDGVSLPFIGGSPAGGSYWVAGTPSGSFDPGAAGLGPEVVEYHYTAPSGCTNVASASVWVEGMEFHLATDSLCDASGPYTLFEGFPAGGTYSGPGVTGSNFDPAAVGTGWVTLCYHFPSTMGCLEDMCDSMYVDVCTSMQGPALAGWECWPNPVTEGIFHLRGPALQGEVHLTLMDAAGRRVHEQVLGEDSLASTVGIQAGGLARGIYLLWLTDADGVPLFQKKIAFYE